MSQITILIAALNISLLTCGMKKDIADTNPVTVQTEVITNGSCTQLSRKITMKRTHENIGNPLISSVKLPSDYAAFTINQNELDALMKNIKNLKETEIFLPTPENCYQFQVKNSGTMSPELEKKYPQIISLRGVDKDNNTADIDYDGKRLKAKINTKMGVYIFENFETDKGSFYLTYLIRNSGYPKSKFE